jgi:2-amino-4-hydroxy-6-hydroxymethyldihydropteridine diphosphokinase
MTVRNKVFLLLGGNIEPRLAFLKQALLKLQEYGYCIISVSSIYESEAWGFESELKFLNKLLIIETDHSPTEMLHDILKIENELGRKRVKKSIYTSRNIDIDILYFNDLFLQQSDLEIPHPRLHKRHFALLPLVELAPEYVHPVLKKTNRELLELLDDSSDVTVYMEKEVCNDEV